MTSMVQRIKGALSSPKGRRNMTRGRPQAARPGMKQKLQQLAQKITGRLAQRP
jgi:hypothetical protein